MHTDITLRIHIYLTGTHTYMHTRTTDSRSENKLRNYTKELPHVRVGRLSTFTVHFY